jgi:hypothetical protein
MGARRRPGRPAAHERAVPGPGLGRQPALLGFSGRDLAGLLVFRMHGDQIQAVYVIADPRQLGFLSAQLG